MKKKILSLFLVISMIFITVGCSNKSTSSDSSNSNTSNESSNSNTSDSSTIGSVGAYSTGADIYFRIPDGYRITSSSYSESLSIRNDNISIRYTHESSVGEDIDSFKKVYYEKKLSNSNYTDVKIEEEKTVTVNGKEITYWVVTTSGKYGYSKDIEAYMEVENISGFAVLNATISQDADEETGITDTEELINVAFDIDIKESEDEV